MLNSFTLKIIAIIFMTLDQVPILIGSEPFPYYHICSRFVGGLFAFLLAEGFYHTSDRVKYLLRLVIAGVIMYAGNHLIAWATGNTAPLRYGMFLTLAAGLCAMGVFEWVKTQADTFEKKLIGITLGAAICTFSMILAESGFYIIPVVLISYFFHGKKLWISLLIAAVCVPLAIKGITYTPSDTIDWVMFFTENCDWALVSVIPFILLYNGKSGPKTGFTKWLFYAYYPLHIWIFTIIGTFIQS